MNAVTPKSLKQSIATPRGKGEESQHATGDTTRFAPLGELVSLISSGSTPLGGASNYSAAGEVMLIRSQNVHMRELVLDDVAFVSRRTADVMARTYLARGDVLLNITGASIGRSALFDLHTTANVNQHVCVIRPKPDCLDARYLVSFLASPVMQRRIMSQQNGGTRQALTFSQIAAFELPLRPLPEQRRIADILEKADAIRRKRKEAIALTEELLRSTFLDMFGDPVSNPKGWAVGTLGEHCDMETGFAFPSSRFKAEGVRLCRGANVLPGAIDWKDLRCWPSDEKVPARYHLAAGDIVLAMDRPWISSGLKLAMMRSEDLPAHLVQRVARLRPKHGLTNEFIYFSLLHPAFAHHCRTSITETTVPHISPHDIRSYPIVVPTEGSLEAFASAFRASNRMRAAAARYCEMADSLAEALVGQAFAGQLKLGVDVQRALREEAPAESSPAAQASLKEELDAAP